MLARTQQLLPQKGFGVLAKMAKPGQDLRSDLPAIGPDTVRAAAAAGLAGIVIEAQRAVIFDYAATVALANEHGLFIEGRSATNLSTTLASLVPKRKIWIITAEASGDALGAALLHELKKQAKAAGIELELSGVGGSALASEGLSSLIPMHTLGIMGFVEVIKHLPRMLYLMRQLKNQLLAAQPDLIVTIDAPDFGCRIVRSLPRSLSKRIHYVAPSVWAYRPERAAKLAQYYDHLLTLLPFEPPYFTAHSLASTFVGHPLITKPQHDTEAGEELRKRYSIPASAQVLLVLLGSRKSELERLGPIFMQAISKLAEAHKNLLVILPTLPHLTSKAEALAQSLPCNSLVLTRAEDHLGAQQIATLALSKSGTITAELAWAGVPMVVAHRINPISAWLLKRSLRVRYVTLVNLLADAMIIPEYLQENCTATRITAALESLLSNQSARAAQTQAAQKALAALRGADLTHSPAEQAAAVVAKYLWIH